MAIKNSLVIKGLAAPEAYSRIAAVNVDSRGTTIKVSLSVEDYANEAAAAKVLEDVQVPTAPTFDPDNPEHKAKLEEYIKTGGYNDSPESQALLQEHLKNWRPTIYVTEQRWLGKRKEDPLQERSLELPLELALQIVLQTVPGSTPDGTADNLTSQAYRAALALPGAFANALSI